MLVDNTFSGPVFQRPLALGADLVLYSLTKYVGGHSDLVAGGVVGARSVVEPIKRLRGALGTQLDPNTAWMIMRSMETLSLRMHKSAQNAAQVARISRARIPKIAGVNYLGFLAADDPRKAVFERQCESAGSTFGFSVKGGEAEAFRLLDGLQFIKLAVSLGGTETLISHPASTTHSGVSKETRDRIGISDALIRISVGIEDPGRSHRRSRSGAQCGLTRASRDRARARARTAAARRAAQARAGCGRAGYRGGRRVGRPQDAGPADIVYRNGFVYTVDAQDSVQQALAVRDGLIVYVGSDAGAGALIGRAHPADRSARTHDDAGTGRRPHASARWRRGAPEMQSELRAAERRGDAGEDPDVSRSNARTRAGRLARGRQLVPGGNDARAGIQATRATLDALKTQRPIFVVSSFGHTALANSRAIELAGISAATQAPLGGKIGAMRPEIPPGFSRTPHRIW